MVPTENLENPEAQSKSEGAKQKENSRLIIWFYPLNKKITKNQFHVEAENIKDALKELEECADFNYKVMGVSNYKEEHAKKFTNKKFY